LKAEELRVVELAAVEMQGSPMGQDAGKGIRFRHNSSVKDVKRQQRR
jgi:hypothetical protein